MNNSPLAVINSMEKSFTSLVQETGYPITWKDECIFARQLISKNDFCFSVASRNVASLQDAILNVAAIGISLNPALNHAYLVPRDGAIHLDISYKGLVKIATESGAIQWAKSELVYKNDKFVYNGPATPPTHEADVFGDRGEMIGGYCIAKLPEGDTLIEVMKQDEILKIRNTSKAYQKNKGPWVDWFEEMAKKTITKRASKSWPQTSGRARLDKTIQVLHESEGTAYTLEQQSDFMQLLRSKDALGFVEMRANVSESVWTALYNSFDKGHKTEFKKQATELEKQGHAELDRWAAEIMQAIDQSDIESAIEIYNDLPAELIEPRLGNYIETIKAEMGIAA